MLEKEIPSPNKLVFPLERGLQDLVKSTVDVVSITYLNFSEEFDCSVTDNLI